MTRKVLSFRISKEDHSLIQNYCRRNGLIKNDVLVACLKPLIEAAKINSIHNSRAR